MLGGAGTRKRGTSDGDAWPQRPVLSPSSAKRNHRSHTPAANPPSHAHFVTSVHKSVNVLTAARGRSSFVSQLPHPLVLLSVPQTRTVPLGQASPSPFQDLALLVPTPVYHPSILSFLFFCRRGDNRSASLSTSKVEMSRGATRDVHTYAHTLNLDLKRPFRPYCSATLNTNCSV